MSGISRLIFAVLAISILINLIFIIVGLTKNKTGGTCSGENMLAYPIKYDESGKTKQRNKKENYKVGLTTRDHELNLSTTKDKPLASLGLGQTEFVKIKNVKVTPDFSSFLWIRLAKSGRIPIFSNDMFELSVQENVLSLKVYNSDKTINFTKQSSPMQLNDRNFHFVGFTSSKENGITFYSDGYILPFLDSNMKNKKSLPNFNGDFYLSKFANPKYEKSENTVVSNLTLWNCELTRFEISNLYGGGFENLINPLQLLTNRAKNLIGFYLLSDAENKASINLKFGQPPAKILDMKK